MPTLPVLLLLLISWTTLASLSLWRAPALGIDPFAIGIPVIVLLAALARPRSWKEPSPLWVPVIVIFHAAMRLALDTDGSWQATELAGAVSAGIGAWIGWKTGSRARQLETALEGILHDSPELLGLREAGQGAMLGEIRRARRHWRPLSVVSLLPDQPVQAEELDRILAEMRRSALRRYTDARLASLLVDRVDSSSVVTRDHDHFVVLLTETDRNEAQQAVARIEHEFSKELGISVRCGISSFPDEETTLTGLLESSELDMRRTQAWLDSTRGPTEA